MEPEKKSRGKLVPLVILILAAGAGLAAYKLPDLGWLRFVGINGAAEQELTPAEELHSLQYDRKIPVSEGAKGADVPFAALPADIKALFPDADENYVASAFIFSNGRQGFILNYPSPESVLVETTDLVDAWDARGPSIVRTYSRMNNASVFNLENAAYRLTGQFAKTEEGWTAGTVMIEVK